MNCHILFILLIIITGTSSSQVPLMGKYRNSGKKISSVLSLTFFKSSLERTRILQENWYLRHRFREKTDSSFCETGGVVFSLTKRHWESCV